MEEEKKELEVDITKIVVDVYTKVANWHNLDFESNRQKGDALKVVSQEIVQSIVDDIFSQINTPTRLEIKRGDVSVGDNSDSAKDKESFHKSKPQDAFSKIFKK